MIFFLIWSRDVLLTKTRLGYGRVLILICFTLLFGSEAKSTNLQIFHFCKQFSVNADKIIASDNEQIILSSSNSINSINLDKLVKNWQYEIPGFLISIPTLEQDKLLLEAYQNIKNQTDLATSQPEITQTTLNINTGIPLEVTKLKKEIKDTYNAATKQLGKNHLLTEDFPVVITSNTDNLISGFKNGSILFMNKESNLPIWKTKVGGEVTSIIILQNGILVGSKDNFIYLLNRKNADIIWKKRISGRILDLFLLEKHVVAVSATDSNEVSLIDTNTGLEAGKIIKDFTGKLIDIKKYTRSNLILLTNSSLILYSSERCK